MEKFLATSIVLSLAFLVAEVRFLAAGSPWNALVPFKRVDADPKKAYELTEENGPWLVLAANFYGDTAEKDARALVQELRSRYKLPAFIHRQVYDFTQPIEEQDAQGHVKRMRYMRKEKYEGIAVLVGNFRSVRDPELESVLEKIKTIKPAAMGGKQSESPLTQLADFRGLKKRLTGQRQKGPMASAFATRNPLLPEEVSAPNGIDDFVARLNKGVEYSLLDNPGRYTVRIATFRGSSTINQRMIEEIQTSDKITDKLQVAADSAHRLTVALRKKKIEAYEFHDRLESIVTVGSFTSEKQVGEMYKIVDHFRASEVTDARTGKTALKAATYDGVKCDAEPMPIEVPRRSIAADYARRNITE